MCRSSVIKVLVLGATGLIGRTFLRVLSSDKSLFVKGTTRQKLQSSQFPNSIESSVFFESNLLKSDGLQRIFHSFRPDVVINAAGITKHIHGWDDPNNSLPINAIFPHQLALICASYGSRLIHISSDCVFNGTRGLYSENDMPDATDLYGLSKAAGEIKYENTVTVRTSTIGHEVGTKNGLLEWFLSQNGSCKGYKNAVFSGLPTVVLAEVVQEYIIKNPPITGLFNVGAQPINKYELLQLISTVYQKDLLIIPDDSVVIDRSLSGQKFCDATGYVAPDWHSLITRMYNYG